MALDLSDLLLIGIVTSAFGGGGAAAARYFAAGDRARLDRLERKVDLILRHLGVEIPSPSRAGVPAGVLEAIAAGNKIGAIKIVRETTGKGLAEAKDYVDEMEQSGA